MSKFHITPNGDPAQCHATVRECPYGGTHYDSMEAAAVAAMDAHQQAAVSMRTELVTDPGEHPYFVVTSSRGHSLGFVTMREGFFLASVHDGRGPRAVGDYEFSSKEEALQALFINDGLNQSQQRH